MLKFTCNISEEDDLMYIFISELEKIVYLTEFEGLTFSRLDFDEGDVLWLKLSELSIRTGDGLIFDAKETLGTEPYGNISRFFEEYMNLLRELKSKFPNLGIDGEIFLNDYHNNAVYRKRVFCTPEMNEIQFIDQRQCVFCDEWVDVADAYKLVDAEYAKNVFERSGCYSLPSVCNNEIKEPFCICKNCKELE